MSHWVIRPGRKDRKRAARSRRQDRRFQTLYFESYTILKHLLSRGRNQAVSEQHDSWQRGERLELVRLCHVELQEGV
jgi:hypothetical protein